MIIIIAAVITLAYIISCSKKGKAGKIYHFTTPSGQVESLFLDALKQPHLLIAGATGSGKSVIINGLIDTLMYRLPFDQAGNAQMILIDPKRVELAAYKNLPHTLAHAAGYDPAAWNAALQKAVKIMDSRYAYMERKGLKMYDRSDLYVIIDEWANVYKGGGKEAFKAVLRLTSEGRAARVHVILATQVPKASIIPTEIRENITARFALRTANAVQSRVIMEESGCEGLPRYGKGYYVTPEGIDLYEIPYTQEDEINQNLAWWADQTGQSRKPRQKAA